MHTGGAARKHKETRRNDNRYSMIFNGATLREKEAINRNAEKESLNVHKFYLQSNNFSA